LLSGSRLAIYAAPIVKVVREQRVSNPSNGSDFLNITTRKLHSRRSKKQLILNWWKIGVFCGLSKIAFPQSSISKYTPDPIANCMQTPVNEIPISPTPQMPLEIILVVWPHVRTRASRECRLRGLLNMISSLSSSNLVAINPSIPSSSCSQSINFVPGPLTLRIMLLVVSSINSTRTWVTPPREPIFRQNHSPFLFVLLLLALRYIPVRPKTRVTFTSLTGTFEESIFAVWEC
jgi:hypothetical protein